MDKRLATSNFKVCQRANTPYKCALSALLAEIRGVLNKSYCCHGNMYIIKTSKKAGLE